MGFGSLTQPADTGDVLPSPYAAVLGREHQLALLDERLAEIGLQNPDEADQARSPQIAVPDGLPTVQY
jgi:hypothetical protein